MNATSFVGSGLKRFSADELKALQPVEGAKPDPDFIRSNAQMLYGPAAAAEYAVVFHVSPEMRYREFYKPLVLYLYTVGPDGNNVHQVDAPAEEMVDTCFKIPPTPRKIRRPWTHAEAMSSLGLGWIRNHKSQDKTWYKALSITDALPSSMSYSVEFDGLEYDAQDLSDFCEYWNPATFAIEPCGVEESL